METGILITVINAIVTPLLVLATLWMKSRVATESRDDKRQDGLIQNVMERVKECETRHEARDKDMREIRQELKNRDAEYVKLFQEHTTLRAKYEVLQADHEELKKEYEETVVELAALKDDIKVKAELVAKEMVKL